ncbi:hypothetical protein P3T76_000313 [Phytophthora citrophthora]|uniref:Transmembrane protein n=1 Tax=Phytophthora citrophthora TaxID=4793 RepID=A0AAD9LSK1_9STRA|nr:hypothetical protein P3T76_000313 [Phytophthora citrophthora]
MPKRNDSHKQLLERSFLFISSIQLEDTMSMTMDEVTRAAQLGVQYITEELTGVNDVKVSWKTIMDMTYESGGLYPTIVGYLLGSVAVLFFTRFSSWMARFVPAVVCLLILMYTQHSLKWKSLEWLLMIAAVTGACCTYAQLASVDLIRDHVASKKMARKSKHD